MSIFKRVTAFLTAVSFAAAFTACGSNTREALTVNGQSVPAGIYIYYANVSFNNALNQLKEEQPDLDTTDLSAVKEAILEGVDVRTWVENKATEMCVDYVMTEQKFEELGLSLTGDDNSYIDMMMSYYWSPDTMEKNGISEDSFRKVVASSYKNDAIFEYYYGVDGQEGVTEDELYDYYKENHIRAQFVRFDLKDGEGNLLKSDGKAEMMEMVKDFQERVEDAYNDGGVEAVMTEMNYVQEDYNYYVTSISEEAAGVEEPSTTTPRATEAPETTTADEEEAEGTEEATGTVEAEETGAEETNADAEGETSEETEETTEAEATDEEIPETTAAPEDEDTPTETEAEGASGEETETQTISHDNEQIINIINPEDYDDEEDIFYSPSEKTYKKLLDIDPADYGKPFIVEEDEQYYLVVRYDITERMNEDDLWTESAMNNTCYSKYSKSFDELMKSWSSVADVQRNDAAYNRYNPYKFDFS